ncbi:WD40-repeat-containing domain protein [Elsinoe ampelina]|uniref:WD40-repeat-containing domain protein n=1 Tax=Elsinoe ampelina TaxID=302913 RepID=A0A6A6G9D0_9PEZI|nr:WD40-repeat-containing domain protein [Elsinoe ampelina]
MSSFFTTPASQRKRKRNEDGAGRPAGRNKTSTRPQKKQREDRDESISGSDSEGVADQEEETSHTLSESSSDDEDAATRRTKLASRYLENTRKEILAEGFDAKDIDNELLAQRMGERLKEDTAETKGKLYRWIADDFMYDECRTSKFSNGSGVVNGVAVCAPYIYTVSKDVRLSKWKIPDLGVDAMLQGLKPKLVGSVRGDRSRKRDTKYDLHTNEIYCVAASQDGRFVATGGKDRKLVVWDAETLKPLRAFTHHRDAVMSVCFRRGTNQLFSASRDRTIKIWSLNELAYVETLYGHQDEIVDVASLNQEHCVTAGARDRTARYWRVVEESQLIFRGGGAHNSLRKRRDEEIDGQYQETKPYHEGSTDRVAMIDEETFVTGSDNGSISLWNINKKKPVFTYPQAHGFEDQKKLEDVSAETHPDPRVLPDPQPRWITALACLPYSNVIFSGSWDGHVRAWRLSEDKRKLESLGPIMTSSGPSFVNGELGHEESKFKGVINDIALFEMGSRGKERIGLVAVTGKEQRLGRWEEIGGRNAGIVVQIPRKS